MKPYQLLGNAREPLPMHPGSNQKLNIYAMTVVVFLHSWNPPGDRHHTGVREHCTAIDWTHEKKYLTDITYPVAEKIILVMDNLNTH